MSQNGPYSGPPWSGGSSDEPYSEPADPWGEQAAASEPSWGGHPPSIPQQPVSYQSAQFSSAQFSGAPMSGPPMSSGGWEAPPSTKRNTPILALVVVLGLLIVAGLGTTAWLLKLRSDKADKKAAAAASAAADPGVTPAGGEDARFDVRPGDCVINQGTDDEPNMRKSACVSGTYVVLKRIDGKTTGKKDAEDKCAKVPGYTKWYFYDSPLDDIDFVLCLKERKA
jgi:hypothetical protein